MTTPNTTPTAPAQTAQAPQVHASKLHTIFSDLEKLIGLAADPAVMAFLPPKYQSYAAAAMLVESVIASVVHPASTESNTATKPTTEPAAS